MDYSLLNAVGEEISKGKQGGDEWRQKKKKPRTYCLQLGRKTGMAWTCVTLMDGTGWLIERVK